MKIIGHRGAGRLAPENTIKAIHAGIRAGADAVEFDVRQSRDGTFVLSHDLDLKRIAGLNRNIRDMSLTEIKTIDPFSGEPIPTLNEALSAAGAATAVVEPKGDAWAEDLVRSIQDHIQRSLVSVIAFNHLELEKFHKLLPGVHSYALTRSHVLRTIRFASRVGLKGVNLKYWLLNPVTYLYARSKKLEIIIYTIDNSFVMRFLTIFYPQVAITTNRPDVLKKITG